MLREYTAAGGVIIAEGKMLLLDRPSRQEVRLPKGHIEADETPAVTALRETTEETGYADLEIVGSLGSQLVEFDYNGDQYRRTEYYFLMKIVSDQKIPRPPHDEVDFRPLWTPLADAIALLTYPSEKDMARKAIALYKAKSPARY